MDMCIHTHMGTHGHLLSIPRLLPGRNYHRESRLRRGRVCLAASASVENLSVRIDGGRTQNRRTEASPAIEKNQKQQRFDCGPGPRLGAQVTFTSPSTAMSERPPILKPITGHPQATASTHIFTMTVEILLKAVCW